MHIHCYCSYIVMYILSKQKKKIGALKALSRGVYTLKEGDIHY